jgi:cytochrome c-type biogenesis protein CcmH
MTPFVLSAALLAVLALAALLPVLWRASSPSSHGAGPARGDLNLAVLRDHLRELDAALQAGTLSPAAHAQARGELEHRVAEDVPAGPAPTAPAGAAVPPQRRLAIGLGLAVPLAAAALYALTGAPQALTARSAAAPDARMAARQADTPPAAGATEGAAPAVTNEQILAMVGRLAERLKPAPDDAEGWRMLARSYETLRRFGDAADAYAQLERLAPPASPELADLLTDHAVALGMSVDRRLTGAPEALIDRALQIDPRHIQALALSGSAAFERADYARAVAQWQAVLGQVPAESNMATSISASIERAKQLDSQKGR